MQDDKDRVGLGKLIYSVDHPPKPDVPDEKKVDNADVQEASEESFPASDAPGFSGSSSTESD